MQNAPYADSKSLEALELSLALAAFAQPVSILLTGASALQLLATQQAELIGHKAFTQALIGLELFDIHGLYVEQIAFKKYNLAATKLIAEANILEAQQIADLIAVHDIVITV